MISQYMYKSYYIICRCRQQFYRSKQLSLA